MRPARPTRASLGGLLLLGAVLLGPGCRATAPAAPPPGGEGRGYDFPRSDLTIIRPDAVLFYAMGEDEIDRLPPAERDGLRAILPEFYAATLRLAAPLRARGLEVVRSSSLRFRFEDSDGRVQFYERAFHPGGAGVILFKHGSEIDAHPGVPSEAEILAAVDLYFGASGPGASSGSDSGGKR